jgi:hypothetical protein
LLAHRRARDELDIAKRNFALAASRAKLTRRLFKLGRENNFSVTDAETAFIRSENRLFVAQSESVNSGYRLMRALGTLVESPAYLKPIGVYSQRNNTRKDRTIRCLGKLSRSTGIQHRIYNNVRFSRDRHNHTYCPRGGQGKKGRRTGALKKLSSLLN